MLSLGGATYTQGGWGTAAEAEVAAQLVWDMFGPIPSGKKIDRPFGNAVLDGFDLDFENPVNNLPAFSTKLRSLMDAAGGRKFYLSAAPQCVFPDAAVGAALENVAFDWVQVQFYNNFCGLQNFKPNTTTQNAFNLDVWDNWAKKSKNPNVKVLLGIPAAPTAAGSGYTTGSQLEQILLYSKKFTNFGGVMMWDMSQLYSNIQILDTVVKVLGHTGSSTKTSSPSTTPISTPSACKSPASDSSIIC